MLWQMKIQIKKLGEHMKKKLNITLVIDQFGETSNGTTVTTRRLAEI